MMGTARTWRELGEDWRRAEARRAGTRQAEAVTRWLSGPEELEEFDWDSLRRVWDDDGSEVHAARAERSLALLNQRLASRRRRRWMMQVASALLTPVAIYLAVRSVRQSWA